MNPTLVTVELDKVRPLKLTLNAMIRFEKETGKKITQIGEDLEMEDLRKILWLCLLHGDSELTEEQVGDMIHMGNMQYVTDKLFEMMGQSVPDEDSQTSNAENPTNPTG